MRRGGHAGRVVLVLGLVDGGKEVARVHANDLGTLLTEAERRDGEGLEPAGGRVRRRREEEEGRGRQGAGSMLSALRLPGTTPVLSIWMQPLRAKAPIICRVQQASIATGVVLERDMGWARGGEVKEGDEKNKNLPAAPLPCPSRLFWHTHGSRFPGVRPRWASCFCTTLVSLMSFLTVLVPCRLATPRSSMVRPHTAREPRSGAMASSPR